MNCKFINSKQMLCTLHSPMSEHFAQETVMNFFNRYSAEENTDGTDKTTTHAYGDLYSKLFEPYRYSAKNMLEIGVYSGASVLAFAEYLENAQLDGIDITFDNIKFGKNHPRIKYHKVDGTTNEARKLFGNKKYDIILDDGSHMPEHQIASFKVFAPMLNKGGMYIIEDINENYVNQLKKELNIIAENNGLTMDWHDLRSIKGRFDDIVAVFRHK